MFKGHKNPWNPFTVNGMEDKSFQILVKVAISGAFCHGSVMEHLFLSKVGHQIIAAPLFALPFTSLG